MSRSPTRKRPCRVCKRWFIPHPRLKDRQKTCGSPQCQREWHRRKCEQWNHNNVDYFKDNYLDKKLEQTGTPRSRLKTGLPLCYVVSFRQACMNCIRKNDTIGYPTTQRRITDGAERLLNPTVQSHRSQRAI